MQRLHGLRFIAPSARALLLALLATMLTSCAKFPFIGKSDPPAGPSATGTMLAVSLNDPVRPAPREQGVDLKAAKNEWASFVLQITDLSTSDGIWVRLQAPQFQTANQSIELSSFEVSQILPMPIDLDRAGFVRHTGLSTASRRLPRALVPAPMDSKGYVNLSSLRKAAAVAADAPGPVPLLLWVDVHVPANTAAGEYAMRVDLMHTGDVPPLASVPFRLSVYDFALPDERHLQMVGEISWDRLIALYPDLFEAVTPRLLNRREKRYTDTVKTLDQLVSLAQRHRTAVFIPKLQPTVKWDNPGQPPSVDWRDFDTIAGPWFKGDAFADKVPFTYWPLPAAEMLDRFNRKSQLDYWAQAATHFDQNDWLGNTAVTLEKVTPGRATPQESVELSTQAAEILAIHPRIRVRLPLEDEQIQLAKAGASDLIEPATTSRLVASVPGLVFSTPPANFWPAGVAHPQHWLRTDLPGLIPYVGAGGDERDVRVWAWLAFLRRAHFILWDSTLPTVSAPTDPGDPNQLVWFYPGKWFGLDEPVPTIQLKWLRRAQQDFEYLWLAAERGEIINAMQMARLITKPVEIQPGQAPDPIYSLMSGTADQNAWTDAQRLLAQTILVRPPGKEVDPVKQRELYLQTLQWARPQERPLLIGRTTEWSWDTDPRKTHLIKLRLGLDVYNASDDTPGGNLLTWKDLPPGWGDARPQPVQIPRLETYHVLRTTLDAKFDSTKVTPAARQPVKVEFTDGFTKVQSYFHMVVPVAASERREGRLSIDGNIDDWDKIDALQDGPLVVMLSRPALQRQEMQHAAVDSKVYSGWTNENFYVAFGLSGTAPEALHRTQNFVGYKDRRAWGEDLCEVLIQPIYGDKLNSLGPVLHIVCKPNGGQWVERKIEGKINGAQWETLENGGIRYAATTPSASHWDGELAIPWKVIGDEHRGLPVLLRFNFIQHRATTGESASWCGPIDYGRDDAMMGVLFLHDPNGNGVNNIVRSPSNDQPTN